MRVFVFCLLVLLLINQGFSITITTFNTSSTRNISFNSPGSYELEFNVPWNSVFTVFNFDAQGSGLHAIDDKLSGYGFAFLGGVYKNDTHYFVVDDSKHRVMVFDFNKNFVLQVGQTNIASNGTNYTDNPKDVFSNGSSFFVSDQDNHRVIEFSNSGNYLKQFSTGVGSGDYQLNSPTGIFIRNDLLYVADTGNSRIMIFWLNGTFNNSITGSFSSPIDVSLDEDGNIFILDATSLKIYKYFPSLTPDGTIGDNQLNFPFSLVVNNSKIYVADTSRHVVKIFSSITRLFEQSIGVLDSPAPNEDDFSLLNSPRGVFFHNNNLYIADALNRVVRTSQSFLNALSFDTVNDEEVDFSIAGDFNSTTTINLDFTELNSFLSSCEKVNGNCSFRTKISTSSAGFLFLNNLNMIYTTFPVSRFNSTLNGFIASIDVKSFGVSASGFPLVANPNFDNYLATDAYDVSVGLDLSTTTLGHYFLFKALDFSADRVDFFTFDYPSTNSFSQGEALPLTLACVTFPVSTYNSFIRLSYGSVNPALIDDESKINLYHCNSWDFFNDECLSSWTKLVGVRDTVSNDYSAWINGSEGRGCFALVSEDKPVVDVFYSLPSGSFEGGSNITLTGTINSSADGSGIHTGSVTFFLNASSGSNVLSDTVLSNGGVFTFNMTLPQVTDTYSFEVVGERYDFLTGSKVLFAGITGCDTNVAVCKSSGECSAQNGYWCGDSCQGYGCDFSCKQSSCFVCGTQNDCTGIGCYWCDSACRGSPCGACSVSNYDACGSEGDCSAVGGVWSVSVCGAPPDSCSSVTPGLCVDKIGCVGAGADWCDGSVCKNLCASTGLEQLDAVVEGEAGIYSFRINIKNDYSFTMESTSLEVLGAPDTAVIVVNPVSADIKPKKSVDFNVIITLDENDSLKNYDITYKIKSRVNGEWISSDLNGLLLSFDLPPKIFQTFVLLKDKVEAGKFVPFNVQVFNARQSSVEVNLTYRIKKGSTVYVEKTETVLVGDREEFSQVLKVPVTLFTGDYVFEITAAYGDRKFLVEEKLIRVDMARPWLIFLIGIGVALLLTVYALKFRGKIDQIGVIEEEYTDFDAGKFKKK